MLALLLMADPYAPPKAGPPAPEAMGEAAARREAGSPVATVLLTLLLLPAGHFYAGRAQRGVLWLLGSIGLASAGAALVPSLCRLAGLATATVVWTLWAPLTVVAAVDAARLAKRRVERARVWLVIVAAAGGVVAGRVETFVDRAVLLEAYEVPAGSMLPTIAVGDHLFVDKKARGRARRGDVVVFPFPESPDQDFVKRVVAVEGDTVTVREGRLYLDGWQVPRCPVGRWRYHDALAPGPDHAGEVSLEFLGDASYLVFDDESAGGFARTGGPWRVKPGEVFVMGDNRNNSHDSRFWSSGMGGGVPLATVRGAAFVVWMGQTQDAIDTSRIGVDLSGARPAPPQGAPDLAAAIDGCMKTRPPGTLGPPS